MNNLEEIMYRDYNPSKINQIFNSCMFTEELNLNSLENRCKLISDSLEIEDLFKRVNFKKIIEIFPLHEKTNYSKAHLLFEQENESTIIKLVSMPIIDDFFEILGFRNLIFSYNKNGITNLKNDSHKNLNLLSELLTKSFDGHDRFEEYCHNIRVGKRTKYLMDCLNSVHPELNHNNKSYCLNFVEKSVQLHDIGKIFIPSQILNKPTKLTEEEWDIMKRHTIYGYLLIRNIPGLELAESVTTYHHEKTDGSGYFGLKGTDIPLVSRFTAISDIYDALISKRAYKEAYSPEFAREILFYNKNDGREVFSKNAYDTYVREYLLDKKNWEEFVKMDSTF